jgi:hypothetical protein
MGRVGRGALYRRWNSKAEMTFASVVHALDLGEPPNTGTLRATDCPCGDRARARQRGSAAHQFVITPRSTNSTVASR